MKTLKAIGGFLMMFGATALQDRAEELEDRADRMQRRSDLLAKRSKGLRMLGVKLLVEVAPEAAPIFASWERAEH